MNKVTIDLELLELSLNGDEQQQAKARNKLRTLLATLLSTNQSEVQRLREALEQLANGSHLDAARNHDDDSLREIAGCCTCGQHSRLLKHADRVDATLATNTAQEVE